MRCYLFQDHQVSVLHDAPQQPSDDGILISRANELDPKRFPVIRLLAIYNGLPGVTAIKRFADRNKALKTLWSELAKLPLGSVKAESKQALLERLLRRPEGSDIDQLVSATGWQRHSVRGVMSGVLRKRRGLSISSTIEEVRRIYRIAP